MTTATRPHDALAIPALSRAAGTVDLPGSKSISNRALLLAALAEGTTELLGLLDADDVARMREALATLGVLLRPGSAPRDLRVEGVHGRFPVGRAELFLGNAGTAVRPLTAALAILGGDYTIRGVPPPASRRSRSARAARAPARRSRSAATCRASSSRRC